MRDKDMREFNPNPIACIRVRRAPCGSIHGIAIRRSACRLALICLPMFFMACLQDPSRDPQVAGIDEFDNLVHSYLNKADAWNAVASLDADSKLPLSSPGGIPARPENNAVPALQKATPTASPKALPKGSAPGDSQSVRFDFSDTANGTLMIYSYHSHAEGSQTDTLAIRWDDQARDTIKDNENVLWAIHRKESNSGRIERAAMYDVDGDSVLNPLRGPQSAVGIWAQTWDQGIYEEVRIHVTAGADGDFGKEGEPEEKDNDILLARTLKMRSPAPTLNASTLSDTLTFAEYQDADGDGIVIANSGDYPSMVVVNITAWDPADKPQIKSSRLRLRLEMQPRDNGQQVIGLTADELLRDGTVSRSWITSLSGDTTVDFSDTLLIHAHTRYPSGTNTLDSLKAVYRMGLGPDRDSDRDDTCYAIQLDAYPRLGEERRVQLGFIPSPPLGKGEEPKFGQVDFAVRYENGTERLLKGTIDANGMEGSLRDRNGKTCEVRWDSSGALKAWSCRD